MNNLRRKAIEKVCERIGALSEELSELQSEEQEAFDNLPESLQYTERGEAMEDAAASLDAVADTLKELREALEEVA